jgi:hypothetical protein
MMQTRRRFLGSVAAAAGLFGGSSPAVARLGERRCRFLFLTAEGGWDPLAVFAPMFDSPRIEMEANTERFTVGDLQLVDHPDRAVTRAFFEARASEIAMLHGVSTRSVNHETCQVVALTGSTSQERPDFATILGFEERASTSLPHLVVSGPSFPGPHTVFVSNAQGYLQETIDGSLLDVADASLPLPEPLPGRMVDGFLQDRAEALRLQHPELVHAMDYGEALARARLLHDGGLEVDLRSDATFLGRTRTAIAALAAGICRCASVGTDFIWDTHDDNSVQTPNFESFFADLDEVLAELASTPGPEGVPLRDDTVVVVTSEMARTPAYNATRGRDHWPYTTMFLIGPGVQGGRSFGGYTDLYTGIGVNEGGDPDPSIPGISAESLGATLLALGDVDPAQYVQADPIPGVLG